MKNKRLLGFTLCLLICLITLSIPCFADSDSADSMVYASGEQLNQIYEALQKDSYDFKNALEIDSLTIVKESITLVYTLNMLEYAKSGKLNVVPMWCSHTGLESRGNGNVYIAKTITSDKQYGGNIMFYIENGVAYNLNYSPSEYSPMWEKAGGMYPASSSYADHAARISSALKETNFVSVHDVKYVVIDSVGEFFYVSNAKHNDLISTGYVSTNASNKPIETIDYSIDATEELLNIAKDYSDKTEAYLKEKAEWEAMHPGEIWDVTGGVGISPIITGCSRVDNILDIASYLNIDYSVDFESANNFENAADVDAPSVIDEWGTFGIIGSAIIVVAICLFFVVKKIKRNRSRET